MMIMFKKRYPLKITFILLLTVSLGACKKDGGINIFSLDEDVTLGLQVDQEIRNNPQEYPLLDTIQYATAYSHLNRIRNTVLNSGKLNYANRFTWKCRIIKNDNVINAFCAPGGNIYVYTGLIKLLDNEAQFAGVIGHEMAHADQRHSTEQLTVKYGIDFLIAAILGNNPNNIAQIAAGLASGLGELAYSRKMEYEADKYAVIYLYPTTYDAASLGDFFVKMQSQANPPEFLSTHPSDENRLTKINSEFQSLGGVHGEKYADRYQQFKNSLP